MFRKQQLDLIIAALLPVCVLGIGFLVFSAMAALNPGESATPAKSGAYYRTPGKDGKWFGPEVQSVTLCAGQNSDYNHGFDIIYTEENASIWAETDAVGWYRTQDWTFGTDGPWGTNSSYITLNRTVTSNQMGGGPIGFPWNGTEIHWRDGNKIRQQTEVHGWWAPNVDWACPKYYKIGGWENPGDFWVDCNDLNNPHYPGDWFDEYIDFEENPVPHGVGQDSENWYDCIDISG